jgi:hypothetical protein
MLKRKYTLTKDGKTESGNFELLAADPASGRQSAQIVYADINQYSNVSTSADGKKLFLYQRTPVGAILADGSTYEYDKQ